jgi:hypothetical protein
MSSVKESVGRGVAAGLMGTVAMTAFQRWVEMPISGRGESYQPAELVERVLGRRVEQPNRRRSNYAAHFGVGAAWGAAHAALARAGVRAPWTAAAAFGLLWPADVTSMAVLGLGDPPWRWAGRDLAVDVADKLVLAVATGMVYQALDERG